jgi:hypothetical protein
MLTATAITALSACGGAAAAPSVEGAAIPVQQSRNPTIITAEELSQGAGGDLYSTIERIRPTFFQTRGSASFGNGAGPEVIKVYVENMARGDVSALRDINSADVQQVQRLNAAEATQRFGTGHTLGAIIVTLKRR